MFLLVPIVIACALLLSTCGAARNALSHSTVAAGGGAMLSGAESDPRERREGLQAEVPGPDPRERRDGLQPKPALDPNTAIDLETAGLVCVRLPGVSYPKTPALDRRVVPLQLGVAREIDRRQMPALSYNYAFRSTCEQERIQPIGTALKAKPGTSAHEAGAALDIAGLRARPDRQLIVAIYKQFGWRHGTADWPHVAVPPSAVGERDYRSWIRTQQAEFNQNRVVGGCRGGPCGGL